MNEHKNENMRITMRVKRTPYQKLKKVAVDEQRTVGGIIKLLVRKKYGIRL